MAGEVNIIEYSAQIFESDNFIDGIPKIVTTQAVTVGARSAALNSKTAYVRVKSNGTAIWIRPGDSAVNAVIDTAENIYIAADGVEEFPIAEDGLPLYTHIDTVQDS